MAYTTASDIANHLGRSLTSQETSLVPTLIDAAKAYIDRRCSRTFELTAGNTGLTKYYDTGSLVDPYVDSYNLGLNAEPKNKYIFIDDVQPGSVDVNTGVTLLNEQGQATTTQLVYLTDYQFGPLDAVEKGIGYNVLYRIGSAWPAVHRGISITGNWCYTTTAPSGVQVAAALIVCYYIRNKQKIIAESIEGYSVEYFRRSGAGEVPNQYLDEIVDQYCPRRIRVFA